MYGAKSVIEIRRIFEHYIRKVLFATWATCYELIREAANKGFFSGPTKTLEWSHYFFEYFFRASKNIIFS